MGLMKGQQHIAVCQAELTVFKEGVGIKAQVEGVGPQQQMIGHGNGREQTTGDQKDPGIQAFPFVHRGHGRKLRIFKRV